MNLTESPMNYRTLTNSGICYNNYQTAGHYIKTPQTPISNEETRRLAGVVAKTRALFENTSNSENNRQFKPTSKIVSSVKPAYSATNLNKPKLVLNVGEYDSDKENGSHLPYLSKPNNSAYLKTINRYSTETPKVYSSKLNLEPGNFYTSELNVSINNDPLKTPVSNGLWSTSEELAKELKIPTSVRQAKMCFENMNKGSSAQQQTPISKSLLVTSNRKQTEQKFKQAKLDDSLNNGGDSLMMNRLDDMLSLLSTDSTNRIACLQTSSSITAPAIYSTNSVGSTSSCETTPRTSSNPTSNSSMVASASLTDSTIEDFEVINSSSQKSGNQITMKIKKLEKNLNSNLKKNEENWNEDLLSNFV